MFGWLICCCWNDSVVVVAVAAFFFLPLLSRISYVRAFFSHSLRCSLLWFFSVAIALVCYCRHFRRFTHLGRNFTNTRKHMWLIRFDIGVSYSFSLSYLTVKNFFFTCYRAQLYISSPEREGERASKKARTPSNSVCYSYYYLSMFLAM